MKPHHHPDASTLMSYAAGSLPDSLSIVVACHISQCEQCQQAVAEAEQLGRFLMEQNGTTNMADGARERIIDLLDNDISIEAQPVQPLQSTNTSQHSDSEVNADVPYPLRHMLGNQLKNLRWKTMAPGLKQFTLPATDGTLRLLRIAPGTSMPIHSHTGSELTLVLKGSYSDELGRFCAGDVADLDPDIEHQPATDTGEDCICLIATDAPLKFSGLVPRLLQPFFQL